MVSISNYNNQPYEISSDILLEHERFELITDYVVPGVYDYYMISNYGRVYHRYLNRIMKLAIGTGGYKFITLSTIYGPKILQIHRLVLIYFGQPIYFPKLDVNHKDGCKYNNNLENLEWCSRSYNIKHAYDNDLHPKGENNVLSKINEETAIKICELLSSNQYTEKEIANILGYPVTVSIVAGIKKFETWTHISKNYLFKSRHGNKVDKEYIEKLCEAFQNNKIDNINGINNYCRFCLSQIGLPTTDEYVEMARKIYTRKHYINISNKYDF